MIRHLSNFLDDTFAFAACVGGAMIVFSCLWWTFSPDPPCKSAERASVMIAEAGR